MERDDRYFLSAILLGIIIGMLLPLMVLTLIACSSPQVNKCTYICPPGSNPPVGCYCAEDEIRREADKLESGGFHP